MTPEPFAAPTRPTGMRTSVLALGIVGALALTGLVGCGVETGGGAAATIALAGRTFLSTGVTTDGAPHDLVAGSRITLTFTDDAVSAQAGCNTMGGSASVTDGRLVVDGPLMSTEMACDPALMAQDTWLADLLSADPAVTVDGDELVLTSGGTVITLLDREVADPDRDLVGTAWTLDGIIAGDAVSSVPAGVTSTLRITADGRLEVQTGCNSGGADVTVGTDSLTIGPVLLTQMACSGAAGEVEAAVLAVVQQGTVEYAVDGPALTLTRGDAGLTYRAG